ncbi:MAG: outer membrane lipoprotein carrier protein LolA [Tannerella sp.]|jgi:outer membrane lipoprotein-sorting protein|nr:outer membrane lipoprotein carrier protein LolA [Tannerella sp.]
MRNKSLTTIITAVILFAASGIPAKMNAQTPDADAIIEKTSQLYEKWGGMDIRFAANIRSEKSGTSESFEGTILMKKNKFVLTTPDMKTWFNGTTQWTYRSGEVNVVTPSGSELRFLNPMLLLQDYKKDFNALYIGESTSANAKMAYDIALTPKKKDDIEKIEVQIEKSTSLPVKLVVTMRNNMYNTITIKSIEANNPPDGIFTFPKAEYPDVEIFEL